MAKHYYCSKCGVELVYTRRAVPGKGTILDLIEPHECDGYAINEAPDGKETVKEILDKLKPIKFIPDDGKPREANSSQINLWPSVSGDKRSKEHQLTSSAPASLQNLAKGGDPT